MSELKSSPRVATNLHLLQIDFKLPSLVSIVLKPQSLSVQPSADTQLPKPGTARIGAVTSAMANGNHGIQGQNQHIWRETYYTITDFHLTITLYCIHYLLTYCTNYSCKLRRTADPQAPGLQFILDLPCNALPHILCPKVQEFARCFMPQVPSHSQRFRGKGRRTPALHQGSPADRKSVV